MKLRLTMVILCVILMILTVASKCIQSYTKTYYYSKYKKYLMIPSLYKDLKYYKYIAEKVNNDEIKNKKQVRINSKKIIVFKKSIRKFARMYNKSKNTYSSIAKKVTKKVFKKNEMKTFGIPPELIAALHYRENEDDFLGGNFKYSPEDGEEVLKAKTKKGRIKEFTKIEAKMFKKKKAQIINIRLRSKSKDIVSMCVFSLLHNGAFGSGALNRNTNNTWESSCYIFSGTNLYKSGKWVEEIVNGKIIRRFLKNKIDEQVGVLRTLDAILKA